LIYIELSFTLPYACREEKRWYLDLDRRTVQLTGRGQQAINWTSTQNYLTMKVSFSAFIIHILCTLKFFLNMTLYIRQQCIDTSPYKITWMLPIGGYNLLANGNSFVKLLTVKNHLKNCAWRSRFKIWQQKLLTVFLFYEALDSLKLFCKEFRT
jgi:hypothetical protein